MSAFVIIRLQPDSKFSYWDDESNLWVLSRKDASRHVWSWAWQLIDNHRLRESFPGDTIKIESAPDADMDFGQ